MPYIADLAAAMGGSFSGLPDTLAVGWLGHGHSFAVGPVPSDAAERLRALHAALRGPRAPMVPAIAAGLHECDLCSAQGRVHLDGLELYVRAPDGGGFEAPAMIVHYIEVHGYCPPPAFVDAVLSAPTAQDLVDEQVAASSRVVSQRPG
jgi:hypothetical protein